jgi:hypothetical protein
MHAPMLGLPAPSSLLVPSLRWQMIWYGRTVSTALSAAGLASFVAETWLAGKSSLESVMLRGLYFVLRRAIALDLGILSVQSNASLCLHSYTSWSVSRN